MIYINLLYTLDQLEINGQIYLAHFRLKKPSLFLLKKITKTEQQSWEMSVFEANINFIN